MAEHDKILSGGAAVPRRRRGAAAPRARRARQCRSRRRRRPDGHSGDAAGHRRYGTRGHCAGMWRRSAAAPNVGRVSRASDGSPCAQASGELRRDAKGVQRGGGLSTSRAVPRRGPALAGLRSARRSLRSGRADAPVGTTAAAHSAVPARQRRGAGRSARSRHATEEQAAAQVASTAPAAARPRARSRGGTPLALARSSGATSGTLGTSCALAPTASVGTA